MAFPPLEPEPDTFPPVKELPEDPADDKDPFQFPPEPDPDDEDEVEPEELMPPLQQKGPPKRALFGRNAPTCAIYGVSCPPSQE